jgi:anthranilate synthase/aminodeoxychorismate synthase-like glutamine amidotransferase
MKILVIDNYDSFTYNLVQLIGNYTEDIIIKRNDKTTVDEISEIKPDKIVISPGPGYPPEAGISNEVLVQLGKNIPVLGVCLGHQCIGYSFGGTIKHAPVLMHGKTSRVSHDNKTIYKDMEQNFEAGRYHSLIIERESLPEVLEISSYTDDGVIMGVRHKNYPIEGIQFHPESILTKPGDQLIKNWLAQ